MKFFVVKLPFAEPDQYHQIISEGLGGNWLETPKFLNVKSKVSINKYIHTHDHHTLLNFTGLYPKLYIERMIDLLNRKLCNT